MKKIFSTVFALLFNVCAFSQTSSGPVTTNMISFVEGASSLGYIGRGTTVTGVWNQIPTALTLTYQSRDFAIGGWSKSTDKWMGSSFYINSDNGNIGIGTIVPTAKLHVNGNTITNMVAFTEGDISLGYLGRGESITGGWNQTPGILSLTYQSRDFAIGGWGKTNNNWMGASLFINSDNGNVGIGTVKPDSRLTVAGKVGAREVKVSVDAGADFVFQKDYGLRPLAEVSEYIKTNKHLPEIASAKEMEKNGLELGQMNIKLLQKIEELTLYMIDISEQLEVVRQENKKIKEQLRSCKK